MPGPIWVTPSYPGKEQIKSSVFGCPNTSVWKSISKNNAVLEQMFITFHDKSLFAVSIYVYIAVHEIFQFTEQFVNTAKHCRQFFSIIPETCWESSNISSSLRTR